MDGSIMEGKVMNGRWMASMTPTIAFRAASSIHDDDA